MALSYATWRWPVLPVHGIRDGVCTCGKPDCSNAGKHPRTVNGVKDASTDPAAITRWWTQWPDANIALATGELVVIDVDPRHGGDESLAAYEAECGPLPLTLRANTGGGGWHLFYRQPPGQRVRGRNPWLPGVEVKADGGYVVLPGSNHVSGGTYTWVNLGAANPVPMPPDLAASISGAASPGAEPGGIEISDPAAILRGVPNGRRDDTLFRWACRLRRQHSTDADSGLSAVSVLVHAAALQAVPPMDREQAEKCIRQAFKQDHDDVEVTPEMLAWANAYLARYAAGGALNLLTAAELMDRPAPEWVVDGVLPVGALFQVFGQTGEFKSFVVLDLAASVSNGVEWMGHAVKLPGLAALVLGEGGADAGQRLGAWLQGHPQGSADLLSYSVEQQLDLMDSGHVDAIIRELVEHQQSRHPDERWRLILFDTQADHMPSGDEDKSRDFTVVKRALQRIRDATGAAVGLVHHTGWDKSRERGSSRQRQALDVVMQVEGGQITNVKQKFAVTFDPIRFKTVPTAGSLYVQQTTLTEDLSGAVRQMSADVRRVLELAVDGDGRVTGKQVKAELGWGHPRWKAAQDTATSNGWLTVDNELTERGRQWLAGDAPEAMA